MQSNDRSSILNNLCIFNREETMEETIHNIRNIEYERCSLKKN